MADIGDQGGAQGPASSSIFLRKTGPLANWIWMALLLLVAVVYSLWKKNRAGAADNVDTTTDDTGDDLTNQTPPPVFILPQNPQPAITINNNETPPAAPAGGSKTPPTTTPPKPTPPTKTPAVAYEQVKVVKYTSKNPPANSTLWGIAKSKGYGSTSTNYASIWNDPKNAALKKKRGSPTKIQPGDIIYVRKK